MLSDLTLGPSFKVKQGEPNLKVLITHLLLVLEVCNVIPTYRKSWAGNLLMWSDLTLGPVLQGQMRIAKHETDESDYNSLIIGPIGLGPLLQGQTRIAKLKSAYNLLIVGLRCLQCETNL